MADRPDARPAGARPRAYQDLSCWLARAVGVRPGGLRGIENTGRQIGRELAPGGGPGAADALETTLVALGFQPTVLRRDDGRITFCLGNCPYTAAVRQNQPAVCALHRGITRGLLDRLAPGATLAGFVPKDPDQAGCVIDVLGLAPGLAPERDLSAAPDGGA